MQLGLNVGYWGMGIGRYVEIVRRALARERLASAVEIADGWLPRVFSPEHVGELRVLLQRGADRGGRSLRHFQIVPSVGLAISDEHAAARDLMRPMLALEGSRDEAAAALPDALIDMVSLCGPAGAVRERLSAFRESGVSTLAVIPMALDRASRIEQLRAVAALAA